VATCTLRAFHSHHTATEPQALDVITTSRTAASSSNRLVHFWEQKGRILPSGPLGGDSGQEEQVIYIVLKVIYLPPENVPMKH
jgi:hypothetical protein